MSVLLLDACCLAAREPLSYPLMQPKFLYFDLGNVLVNFSVEQMLRQIGDVAGIDSQQVRDAVFDHKLLHEHELGRLSSRQFHEAFCAATGTCAEFDRLAAAASEIFELNLPVLPIVAQLQRAGYRMGILSNTCDTHWDYCINRYAILSEAFSVHALSYRIGAVKPEAAIFRAAAEMAGCRAEEIFFVDDIAGHVAGARAAGLDAVQFTGARALVEGLRRRDVRFNF
jgi:glucose-1-phosphatase